MSDFDERRTFKKLRLGPAGDAGASDKTPPPEEPAKPGLSAPSLSPPAAQTSPPAQIGAKLRLFKPAAAPEETPPPLPTPDQKSGPLTFALTAHPGAPAQTVKHAPGPEAAPRRPLEKKHAKAPVRRRLVPGVFVGLACLAVISAGGFAAWKHLPGFTSKAPPNPAASIEKQNTPPAVSPKPAPPQPSPSTPVAATTKAPKTPGTPAKPLSTPEPAGAKNAELAGWLANSRVTTTTTKRLAMNGAYYSIGDFVRRSPDLKWLGRDTVTGSLLFIDAAGTPYEKAAP